jgi:integrase/recombinase XerC
MSKPAETKTPQRLDDFADRFVRHLRAEKRASAYTVRNYAATLAQFSMFLTSHLGRVPARADLERLELIDFRAFLSSRRDEGLGAASLKLELSALKSFYRFLGKRHDLANDAIEAMRGPKLKAKLPRPIDAAAAARVIDLAGEGKAPWIAARDVAVFTVLYGAGLRISEALSLKLADAPFGDWLRIKGKGDKMRAVPLIPAARDALQAYVALRPEAKGGADALFLGARRRPLSPRIVQAEMKRHAAALGLEAGATPHALRHAFATQMLAAGGDLRAVQELLGHASIAATQRYTKIDAEGLLAAHRGAHPRAR